MFDDLAAHAARQRTQRTAMPAQPNPANHQLYAPIVEKYIRMEQMLNQFFED